MSTHIGALSRLKCRNSQNLPLRVLLLVPSSVGCVDCSPRRHQIFSDVHGCGIALPSTTLSHLLHPHPRRSAAHAWLKPSLFCSDFLSSLLPNPTQPPSTPNRELPTATQKQGRHRKWLMRHLNRSESSPHCLCAFASFLFWEFHTSGQSLCVGAPKNERPDISLIIRDSRSLPALMVAASVTRHLAIRMCLLFYSKIANVWCHIRHFDRRIVTVRWINSPWRHALRSCRVAGWWHEGQKSTSSR